MSRLLVVTGSVGVGKTTVAWEMGEVLEERSIAYGFFDPDAIHFRPTPAGDRFGSDVWFAALDAAWPLMGVDRLIVPLVVESRDLLGRFPHDDVVVARLTAAPAVIEERIRRRELGAGLDWHLARARELEAHWRAQPVEDFVVDTAGRPVREPALEVLARAGWISD